MVQPRFWATPGLEPKRAYRWLMRFANNGSGDTANIDEWFIKKVTRPSWSLSETKHNFLNHTFYYPGRIEYDELNVTLVDTITPNGAVNMQNLLVASGYIPPDAAARRGANYATISKDGWGTGGAGLANVEIVQLNEMGEALETWQLKNTWIKTCKLSELSYEDDELTNIELTLRYDFFKVENSDGVNPKAASLIRAK